MGLYKKKLKKEMKLKKGMLENTLAFFLKKSVHCSGAHLAV